VAVSIPRRSFARQCLVVFSACLAACAAVLEAGQRQATRPPNIVFIFADDLGWKDVGYQGTDFYETPNIDRLARAGMVFTQAYAGAANCAPSRAVLLSGQYTPRHGVYAVGDTNRGPRNLMRLIPVPNRSGLSPASITMAEALRAAGYTTGIFGKWHLAGPDGASPDAQGFDVAYDPRAPNPNTRRDEPDDPKGIYSITQAALSFIESNRDRPFFAYVSHHAIHTSLEARPSSLEKFQAKSKGTLHGQALYAACLYDLDDGVRVLLDGLRSLGLDGNTLVVFTSDNGGTMQSSQEPLRGNKGAYYEGGIREPFIAYWPGVIEGGSRSDVPVHSVDLYPTFLDVAGATAPAGHVLDGESLVPVLRGQGGLGREAIYWHFPGYLNSPVIRGRDPVFRTRPVSVIRKGDWKLHLYHEEWQLDGGRARVEANRSVELYDMRHDIGEWRNLANENPTKRDELLDDLLEWFTSVRAVLPSERNPAYGR